MTEPIYEVGWKDNSDHGSNIRNDKAAMTVHPQEQNGIITGITIGVHILSDWPSRQIVAGMVHYMSKKEARKMAESILSWLDKEDMKE